MVLFCHDLSLSLSSFLSASPNFLLIFCPLHGCPGHSPSGMLLRMGPTWAAVCQGSLSLSLGLYLSPMLSYTCISPFLASTGFFSYFASTRKQQNLKASSARRHQKRLWSISGSIDHIKSLEIKKPRVPSPLNKTSSQAAAHRERLLIPFLPAVQQSSPAQLKASIPFNLGA